MNTFFNARLPRMFIDIEAEQDYWQEWFHNLPQAAAARSFHAYWPVIGAVYDIYINHPGWDSDRAQARYALCAAVQLQGLSDREASEVFSQVWGRISGERLGRAALESSARRHAA
ncbi:hypothetical protein SAMN05428989_0990 [Pseudoxanthomonas sp. GM95]|uniref:hypothetical protein n=1 Tax=Pseudoxanthomonas sp. GM95 TaxID=1881043 RepID=UPI0008B3AD26|nr:hypothetical protein [Pseudoxanthomonas sp. GM95]SEK87877.1 hypothetical protein SAMN05428989_0990 [Pseudoxanthomonas sp. GM95]